MDRKGFLLGLVGVALAPVAAAVASAAPEPPIVPVAAPSIAPEVVAPPLDDAALQALCDRYLREMAEEMNYRFITGG